MTFGGSCDNRSIHDAVILSGRKSAKDIARRGTELAARATPFGRLGLPQDDDQSEDRRLQSTIKNQQSSISIDSPDYTPSCQLRPSSLCNKVTVHRKGGG